MTLFRLTRKQTPVLLLAATFFLSACSSDPKQPKQPKAPIAPQQPVRPAQPVQPQKPKLPTPPPRVSDHSPGDSPTLVQAKLDDVQG